MTLVLGTWLGNCIILSADSKVQKGYYDSGGCLVMVGSGVDRKLFKIPRVGVATYGIGPTGGIGATGVPALIDSGLQPEWGMREVIGFLQQTFKGCDQMGAIVGGLEDSGPVLFDVHMDGRSPHQFIPLFGEGPPLVWRGDAHPGQEAQKPSATVGSIIDRMLGLLQDRAGCWIGPPYEFLLIQRDANPG